MKLRQGDMFSPENTCNVLLVTTNAYIKVNGELVMGRGAAYTMTQKYPGSQAVFGNLVSVHAKAFPNEPYGVLISYDPRWDNPFLGIFQVKRFFRDMADLGLIEHSCNKLLAIATANPAHKFAVNYPGIGNGQLRQSQVAPLLARLPDNVEVWTI